jgi:hypothetical protein
VPHEGLELESRSRYDRIPAPVTSVKRESGCRSWQVVAGGRGHQQKGKDGISDADLMHVVLTWIRILGEQNALFPFLQITPRDSGAFPNKRARSFPTPFR